MKRAMTLLEIMIVIVLIGIIASVVGYNMKGSLDEGKAFKTRQAQEQIRDILLLEYANAPPEVSLDTIINNATLYLKQSGLVKDADSLVRDGWGKPLIIRLKDNNEDIEVLSDALDTYNAKKKK